MIDVAVADLADVRATALVRPATTHLRPVGDIAERLDAAAGQAFIDTLLNPRIQLGIGSAIVTGAGQLDAEFLIHAVIASDQTPATLMGLQKALQSTLQRVRDWEFSTVAVSVPETDTLVTQDTAPVIAQALSSYVKEPGYRADVLVVVESDDVKALFDTYLSE